MGSEADVAVVADVHTSTDAGQTLEEGVGDVFDIYVLVPLPREPSWGDQPTEQHIVRGGVFSYYEFKWPMSDRLTDEAWRAMDPRPPLPTWTSSFVVEP
jgi:hypothetical protein